MPANLTPEYHRAEEQYRTARTPDEKLAALEEMLRVVPKHKGTDGLQADLKARIAKLRKQPGTKAGKATFSHMVPREGAGQVALVGLPNTGKSALVAALTHATPEVADYPFTTREATPGMMLFEDVKIQLVDLPPLSSQHIDPWVFDLIRVADLLWIVVDGASPLEELEECGELLASRGIGVEPPGCTRPQPEGVRLRKKALLVMTGVDRVEVAAEVDAVDELLEHQWPLSAVSATTGAGLDALRRATWNGLGLIRVYTKQPGKPADRQAPFTLPVGSTVADLAGRIHKDLVTDMKFARIWGTATFDGQTVQREHVLHEGDVVELHE